MSLPTNQNPDELKAKVEELDKELDEIDPNKEVSEESDDKDHEPDPAAPTPPIDSQPVDEKDSAGNSYKDKFHNSSQEAMVMKSKFEKLNGKFAEAFTLPEASEEELKAEYPEWDKLSEFEKRMAKGNFENQRSIAYMKDAVAETKQKDAWIGKVDTFLSDDTNLDKYQGFRGREAEFKEFVSGDSRVGMDLDDAVKVFLYSAPRKPKAKATLLEPGTGGEAPKVSGKLSLTEAASLRKTNQREYQRLVKEGKIDDSID